MKNKRHYKYTCLITAAQFGWRYLSGLSLSIASLFFYFFYRLTKSQRSFQMFCRFYQNIHYVQKLKTDIDVSCTFCGDSLESKLLYFALLVLSKILMNQNLQAKSQNFKANWKLTTPGSFTRVSYLYTKLYAQDIFLSVHLLYLFLIMFFEFY